MNPLLFDPSDPPDNAWPSGNEKLRLYLEGLLNAGFPEMIPNVRTRLMAMRIGDRVLPITVNDGEIGGSYVSLPHSAYVLYARDELALVDVGAIAPIFHLMTKFGDALLKWGEINKVVHIDNWLLSTNLHGGWRGDELPKIRSYLEEAYPEHLYAIRSIDRWSSAEILNNARADGWATLPSRQIWVTDDMEKDWRRRNNTRNDFRLMRKTRLRMERLVDISVTDAARIAELYKQLYIGKYSQLNPDFQEKYIAMTANTGAFEYYGARDERGELMAVAGCFIRNGMLTAPIVGYDTSRPKSEGLYRIASMLFSEAAYHAGLRLHGSAGAADFKRLRGAVGEIEYNLFYARHASPRKRLMISLMGMILNGNCRTYDEAKGL